MNKADVLDNTVIVCLMDSGVAAGRPRDRCGIPDPGLRGLDQNGTIQELLA
jgi:hypothetical protein